MVSNIENKRFNELTEEELNQLSEKEVVDKSLSEYVDDINLHVKEIDNCKKNIVGSLSLAIIVFFTLGFIFSLIPLVITVFYTLGLYKMKKSIVWYVKSFKTTASMYSGLGYDIFIENHLRKIDKRVNIGELYK